jgi:hypothetical protein
MAPRSSSVAELSGDGLGYLKSSGLSAALEDRPSTILVNRPQHVACFCSQIGLSVLLIGIIPLPRSAEPFCSIFVICQLLTAFLLARFFEWIAQKKKPLSASAERFAASHRTLPKVKTAALSASMNQLSAFAVATKARAIVNTGRASVTGTASTPRQNLSFQG